jgi:hypothetical protein
MGIAVGHRPEMAAMSFVAMTVPEEIHAVIDERLGTGAAHETGDGEAVDHARRHVNFPQTGTFAGHRLAFVIEREETAGRVDAVSFEESQQVACLIDEPVPMIGESCPLRRCGGRQAHWRSRCIDACSPAAGSLPAPAVPTDLLNSARPRLIGRTIS